MRGRNAKSLGKMAPAHRVETGNHKRAYATLRGETPLFGVAFALRFASLTGIQRRGENALVVFSGGESVGP